MSRWLMHMITAFAVIALLAVFTSTIPLSPAAATEPSLSVVQATTATPSMTRISGADMQTSQFGVAATDLLIPFTLENGSVGFLGGDTFTTATPGIGVWRSPIMLRSNQTPIPGQPLVFDSAAGLSGDGIAPDIMPNGHMSHDEQTVIPTDGVSFPETGNEIVSYMSVQSWWPTPDQAWTDNYAGLAWSPDGNTFYRIGPTWVDDPANDNPFQVMSMQRDGDYVYIVSVRAGRQPNTDTPMMLQRVPWNNMLDQASYQCWTGSGWTTDYSATNYSACQPILTGSFGEPSLRLLSDGTWAMSYMDASSADAPWIVTRTATSPTGPWTQPKVQLTWEQNPFLYGGFIYPRSTKDNLLLMVSTWVPPDSGLSPRYDVSVFQGTL